MLDVIHYFFEEDLGMKTQEELNAKNGMRKSMYENMYDNEYGLLVPKTKNNASANDFDFDEEDDEDFEIDEPIQPFNPRKNSKSFVPPTPLKEDSIKPFGDILDSPIG